jgi:hypothetical protein
MTEKVNKNPAYFELTAARESVFVWFDDTAWFTPEWIKDWQSMFYSYDRLEQFADHIAYLVFEHNCGDFAEGYGPVELIGKNPLAWRGGLIRKITIYGKGGKGIATYAYASRNAPKVSHELIQEYNSKEEEW